MIPRKKRARYREQAKEISARLGIKVDLKNWREIWALLDEHKPAAKPMFVYAIGDARLGLVKFGKSYMPRARLKQLRTGNASPDMKLWGFCPEKGELTERYIHERLSEFRVFGEWFKLNDEAQTVIDEMRAAAGIN